MVQRLDQSVGELCECLVGVAGQLQRHVVHVHLCEDLGELLAVDLCQLCDPVVSEQVGVLFRLAAVVLIVHRHALPACQLGGHEAAVSLDYIAGRCGDCDRCPPACLSDYAGEQLDLILRVRVRVQRVREQLLDVHDLVVSAEHWHRVRDRLVVRVCSVAHALPPSSWSFSLFMITVRIRSCRWSSLSSFCRTRPCFLATASSFLPVAGFGAGFCFLT